MFCLLYVGKWSNEKWLSQDNQYWKKSIAQFAYLKFDGPNSKLCICKVRAARTLVTQGLAVAQNQPNAKII